MSGPNTQSLSITTANMTSKLTCRAEGTTSRVCTEEQHFICCWNQNILVKATFNGSENVPSSRKTGSVILEKCLYPSSFQQQIQTDLLPPGGGLWYRFNLRYTCAPTHITEAEEQLLGKNRAPWLNFWSSAASWVVVQQPKNSKQRTAYWVNKENKKSHIEEVSLHWSKNPEQMNDVAETLVPNVSFQVRHVCKQARGRHASQAHD